jgi:carbon-monoxide dehydrogenase medium subunit
MKPPPFTYHAPASLAEALELLRSCENGRLLAGGQSLMPMMNMRYAQPDHVIDINNLSDLSYIREVGPHLEIGAMTRQREIEFSDLIAARCPILRDAVLQVGHRQTRNRGTIGGSLCHLDPAAELPLIAALYDATIVIAGAGGRREAPFSVFAQGFMTPGLASDEMVTAIRFPVWEAGTQYGFVEFARRHGDFALAAAAVTMRIGQDGRIGRIAVAVGGVGPIPLRLAEIEPLLQGKSPSSALFDEAAKSCAGLEAMDDVHAPASYRRHLAGVVLKRALAAAANSTSRAKA